MRRPRANEIGTIIDLGFVDHRLRPWDQTIISHAGLLASFEPISAVVSAILLFFLQSKHRNDSHHDGDRTRARHDAYRTGPRDEKILARV